jgi:glycosyltransferase involved in cell wall biosynthesis
MKENIGLLIPNLMHGGAERVIAHMSSILSLKHNVFLILFDGKSVKYDYSGTLIDLDCPPKNNLLQRLITFLLRIHRLNKIKKIHNITIVISFLKSANLVNYYSNFRSKKVISCRGYRDFNKSSKLYAKMLLKVNGIIFPAKLMSDKFVELYKVDKTKVFTIHNTVNVNSIKELMDKPVEPLILEFLTTHKTICSMGSFKHDKGQWNLIKSFNLLKNKVPNAGLIFIGDGGEYEQKIKEMSRENKYKDDIIFLGHQSNPYRYISKCDVFVLTSINEGFPNALLEAIVCNVSVVSTDCDSGPREILSLNNPTEKVINRKIKIGRNYLIPAFSSVVNFEIDNISKEHIFLAEAMYESFGDTSKMTQASIIKNFENNKFSEKIFNLISFLIHTN